MEFFRGQERKGLAQIEARLGPENRERPGAGAVLFRLSILEDEPEEIEVLPH
jgi:hypothetical protein